MSSVMVRFVLVALLCCLLFVLFFCFIGLLPWLRSFEISGQVFRLIFSFLSNKRLLVVLDGKKSLQEYPVNAGVPQGSILGPALILLYISDLPGDVACDIAIYTLHFKACVRYFLRNF